MGTRGLVVVVKDGQNKVAQYFQYDGYPSGVGAEVLDFIDDPARIKFLERGLENVYFASEDELHETFRKYDADNDGFMSDKEYQSFTKDYPQLSRGTGAGILNLVANSTRRIPLQDESDFANDSLFCEGVYKINLDTRKFLSFYHDVASEFDLDNLPTLETYLNAMKDNDE